MNTKYCLTFLIILFGLSSYEANAKKNDVKSKTAKVTISSCIQVRFQHTNGESETPKETFNLRRARLQLKSELTKELSTTLEVDVLTHKVESQDVYLKYDISPDFTLKAGQQKKPFSLARLLPAPELLMVDRPRHVEWYFDGYMGRDVGLVAKWAPHRMVDVAAGVFNGAGTGPKSKVDDNNGKDVAMRIEITPIKGLTFGGNTSVRMLSDEDEAEDMVVIGYGCDVFIRKSGFQFIAEGLLADQQRFYSTHDMLGLYATATYKKDVDVSGIAAVEQGGRVEFFDSDLSVQDDAVLSLTPYIGFYFHKHARLQLNAVLRIPQQGDTALEFVAQAQMEY